MRECWTMGECCSCSIWNAHRIHRSRQSYRNVCTQLRVSGQLRYRLTPNRSPMRHNNYNAESAEPWHLCLRMLGDSLLSGSEKHIAFFASIVVVYEGSEGWSRAVRLSLEFHQSSRAPDSVNYLGAISSCEEVEWWVRLRTCGCWIDV